MAVANAAGATYQRKPKTYNSNLTHSGMPRPCTRTTTAQSSVSPILGRITRTRPNTAGGNGQPSLKRPSFAEAQFSTAFNTFCTGLSGIQCPPTKWRSCPASFPSATPGGETSRVRGIFTEHAETVRVGPIGTMNLGYMYRSDGNYLVRQTCAHCSQPFDTYALARPVYDADCCPRCRARKQSQREQEDDIQAPRKSTRGFQWDA
jgi:hypothetical protein